MPPSLLSQLCASATAVGADLVGVVDAGRYDAGQPKERRSHVLMARCGAVVVLASGGKDARRLPAAALQQVAATLRGAGLRAIVAEPERCPLSFARLAEAAGFGTVSPVTGLLLHPEFGPWVRIHGAVLVEGQPFGSLDDCSITDSFQPCCKCRMPCLEEAEPAASCHIGAQHRGGAVPPGAVPRPARVGLLHIALRFVPRFLRR